MGKKRLIRLIAAAAVYIWAAAACLGAWEGENTVYLALEEGAAPETVEEIFTQEEAAIGCCFWGETEGQSVSCPVTGRTAEVTRVYLGGNTGLLGAGALAWQDGCLLDAQTAQDLFGTDVCGGQELFWNGKSYPVLGTVSTLRPALIMNARQEDPMDRCVLALPAENGKLLGEQFLLRFGLRGKVLDFYPIWALARNLLLLAPMALLASLYGYVGAGIARPQAEDSGHCEPSSAMVWRSHKIFWKLLILALLLLLLWKGTVIPPEMIPSRWSDFSFWGSWWESQTENFHCMLFTPLGGRQLQILLNMVKSMGGSILAAILAGRTARRRSYADTAD